MSLGAFSINLELFSFNGHLDETEKHIFKINSDFIELHLAVPYSGTELYDIAKNPNKWKKSIETAWDISKITAEHFKDTSETLANIAIGRKISKIRRMKEQSSVVFKIHLFTLIV